MQEERAAPESRRRAARAGGKGRAREQKKSGPCRRKRPSRFVLVINLRESACSLGARTLDTELVPPRGTTHVLTPPPLVLEAAPLPVVVLRARPRAGVGRHATNTLHVYAPSDQNISGSIPARAPTAAHTPIFAREATPRPPARCRCRARTAPGPGACTRTQDHRTQRASQHHDVPRRARGVTSPASRCTHHSCSSPPRGTSLLCARANSRGRERDRQTEMAMSFVLSTGAKMPSVGLGTWQTNPDHVGNAVYAAVKAGYRHIDCARDYGNEKQIGLALQRLFEEGVVKREDLFITSKLWCDHHAPEDVPEGLNQSLNDLQLDYLDLYLIHWPFKLKKGTSLFDPANYLPVDIPATWAAMEKLYDAGKARTIGVSNFSSKKLGDLLAVARVPPAVNQVECHPGWQQTKLHSFCQSAGVHLLAYSPLGSPGTAWVNRAVLEDPILISIAEKLGKTPAQVALRWNIQMGHGVLPKSVNEERMKQNLDVYGWSIPDDLLQKFSEIEQVRLLEGYFFVNPQSIYKTLEELWDGEI